MNLTALVLGVLVGVGVLVIIVSVARQARRVREPYRSLGTVPRHQTVRPDRSDRRDRDGE